MSIQSLLSPNGYRLYCAGLELSEDPVVIGANASAGGGSGGVSIGLSSQAAGSAAISIGGSAAGANSLAAGALANAAEANAVCLGAGSQAQAGAANAVCLGAEAAAGPAAQNSTCLGAYANTAAANDISLGYRAGESDPVGTGVFRIAGLPAPAAAVNKNSTHEVPIYINGTLYNFLVSNV